MTVTYCRSECTSETRGALSGACLAEWSWVCEETPLPANQPRLLDRLRLALRSRHYSSRTESTYLMWVRRFIFFHKLRHPENMAEPEMNAFLTHLAVERKVSASTQNQALSALLFLYRHVLGREVGPQGRPDDHDLHTCSESRPVSCSQSGGRTLRVLCGPT